MAIHIWIIWYLIHLLLLCLKSLISFSLFSFLCNCSFLSLAFDSFLFSAAIFFLLLSSFLVIKASSLSLYWLRLLLHSSISCRHFDKSVISLFAILTSSGKREGSIIWKPYHLSLNFSLSPNLLAEMGGGIFLLADLLSVTKSASRN